MPTDTIPVTAPAGGLAAEIRAAIEAINRRTGYLGPSVHQLERWAAEAERLEASRLHKPEVPRHRVANPIPQREADDAIDLPRAWNGSQGF